MDLKNKRIPDDEFARLRQEVLAQWPTGKGVDLQEAVDYHKAMPEERIFSKKLLDAKEAGRTLVQPRAGVPVISEHIKLLEHLQDEGEADLLPTTIDSYTRQNRYEEAENGIRESIRLGRRPEGVPRDFRHSFGMDQASACHDDLFDIHQVFP